MRKELVVFRLPEATVQMNVGFVMVSNPGREEITNIWDTWRIGTLNLFCKAKLPNPHLKKKQVYFYSQKGSVFHKILAVKIFLCGSCKSSRNTRNFGKRV